VAQWLAERLGRRVSRQLGWTYLRRLGARWCKPRPRHVRADPQAQMEFKAHLRPLLRQVATAFPHATVELWAVDEHRIGLKPILHKVWCIEEQRPLTPVQHRFEWCYLVGFVHPASGRTVFHLATTVSIPLFEVELEAFARQVGASPTKQVVLVLDRAGWHSSVTLHVPDHLHVLFLPAHSPELQPAEHLWPLTNTALANRHFASIDELEDAQVARCRVLQAQPDLMRQGDLLLLVASTYQETTRSQAKLTGAVSPVGSFPTGGAHSRSVAHCDDWLATSVLVCSGAARDENHDPACAVQGTALPVAIHVLHTESGGEQGPRQLGLTAKA
jgi:transposase